MDHSDEYYVRKFLDTIKARPVNTKKLFAIGFIGLNGVGKSFVAQKISKQLNLYVASNDKIRRFLNEQGFVGSSPNQELLQKIAEESSHYLYKNKISHIIDNDLIKFHEKARKNAEEKNAKIYIIHLVCPENIIIEKLRKRQKEISIHSNENFSRVGEEEYFKRKELHRSIPINNIFLTIDTSKDLASQINKLVTKLKQEQVL